MPDSQPLIGLEEAVAVYLRLSGGLSHNMPIESVAPKNAWIKPRLFLFLQHTVNSKLMDTSWSLKDDTIIQDPLWDIASLVDFAFARGLFPSEGEATIKHTIDSAIRGGSLARGEDPRKVSITRQGLDSLLKTAKDAHRDALGRGPPAAWNVQNKEWLPFNERVFAFFVDDVGKAWRNIRHEVNSHASFARRKKGRKTDRNYTTDHVGDPATWTVLTFVTLFGPVQELNIYTKVDEFHLDGLIEGGHLARATDKLCNDGILVRQDRMIDLAPRLSQLGAAFKRTLVSSVPRLLQDILIIVDGTV